MAKMTDEAVAKALGVQYGCAGTHTHRYEHENGDDGLKAHHHHDDKCLPPAYTTDLNVILDAINRLGLTFSLYGYPAQKVFRAHLSKKNQVLHDAPTAPLALCAALLAYLKENKR